MDNDARHNRMNIAITGIGGIFPGASNCEAFWNVIANGTYTGREIPVDRWPVDPQKMHHPGEAVRDQARSTRACLLESLAFNPADYPFKASVLNALDPLFHMTLMAGHRAWNDQVGTLPDPRHTGIIIGNIALPTETLSAVTREMTEPAIRELVTGQAPENPLATPWNRLNCFPVGLPAGLLARSLNLEGGWLTLDAACASSLYALKLAINELATGRLDAVISGGVGRPDSMYTQMGFSQLRAVSPTGVCAPFDSKANGLVIGEGAGLVVLRRLDDAIRSGNQIYGVIQGIGLSNDIGGSLFAPDSDGQVRAMSQAYHQTGWSPESIDLVECHGTGTPVGDAVEFSSMKTVWNQAEAMPSGRCVIGSVKSNIGHLLTGAGGAGLIKVLMAMQHQTLPPTANFKSPGDTIPLNDSPFRVLQTAEPWNQREPDTPRRAAISAFGFGGINAHVLIEEHHAPDKQTTSPPIKVTSDSPQPIAVVGLSAAAGAWPTLDRLQQQLMGLEPELSSESNADYLTGHPLFKSSWFRSNLFSSESIAAHPLDPTYIPIGRFRIPPAELREMLPQQLLMLKTAGDALDQSAWRSDLANESGVFIGIGLDLNTTNFQIRWSLKPALDQWGSPDQELTDSVLDAWSPPLTANRTMGALGGIVASRVARAFKVGGVGFTISSEESSGIKALESAVRMIQQGDLKQAIVGAVDLATDWRMLWGADRVDNPAPEHTTDGAVALILKSLAHAEADGDTILAVIDDIGTTIGTDDVDIESFPNHIVQKNLGWTGSATGLFNVATAIASLHQRVLPGNTAIGPQYWLQNAADGPRRTVVRQMGSPADFLGNSPADAAAVILSEHVSSRDKALRLPLLTPTIASTVSQKPAGVPVESKPVFNRQETAFVYPGSGSHRPYLGRDLSFRFRHIMDDLNRSSQRLKDQFQPTLYWNTSDRTQMDLDAHGLIVGHVTHCFFLTELLRRSGAIPGAIIGYSLGESTGLVSQQIWPDRDAVLQKLESTNLFTEALGGPCTALLAEWELPPGVYPEWNMAIVNVSREKLLDMLDGWPRLYLLIRNLPDQCVIGGHGPDLVRFLHEFDLATASIPVSGVTVAHVPAVHEVADDYLALHYWPIENPNETAVYSGAWKKAYSITSEACSEAILAHATEGIDYPATIEAAHADGITQYVEVGPGNACSRMISRILSGHAHTTRHMASDGHQPDSFLALLTHLQTDGWPIDLSALMIEQPSIWKQNDTRGHGAVPCHPVWDQPTFPTIVFKPVAATDSSAQSRVSITRSEPLIDTMTMSSSERLAHQLTLTTSAVSQAQHQFTELSRNWTESMRQLISFQTALLPLTASVNDEIASTAPSILPQTPVQTSQQVQPPVHTLFMDRHQCLEFATGSIGAVLGPQFAEADTFPTRVRLPDEPLMLVDRIVSVTGTVRSMQTGSVVTEHDVRPGSWYLDQDRCPVCITVEAGQADLFLSGYLGIDFETRGIQKYRLLDAEITMHRGLPRAGETIRYDIRINRFFKQGGVWLFNFEYDATINGQPMLTMRNGCAGFFSDEELDQGQGIVKPRIDATPVPEKQSSTDHIFVDVSSTTYSAQQLNALRRGDLAGCFGPLFAGVQLRNPPVLPGGKMQLIDRIVALDPAGGPHGLGFVKAEADIDPNAWFLTCHFVDDMVMPGTLMYECCFHAFRVLLMRLGWLGEADTFGWDTRPGVVSKLKCRGQVIQSTKMAAYEITIKEIGFDPAPYAIADTLMFADGRPVVEIQNMSVQLNGLTRQSIEAIWASATPALPVPGTLPALFDSDTIMAFSNGKPSEAFGDRYSLFDGDDNRVIARLPGPPYQFLDRVVTVTSPKWEMKAGGTVIGEYVVPDTEWYFDANGKSGMPFSVLLEIALQPCGWYSAYMGSALQSDIDLSYRNLGGSGVIHRLPEPGSGPIGIAVDSTNVSKSGGMIIQNFTFRVYDARGDIYLGDTYFGFFTRDALADQIGIREESLLAGFTPKNAGAFPADPRLPSAPLQMMDTITTLDPVGGPDGLGFVEGQKRINPDEWFFKAHFYQDPVWPGSLGLEAMLQLMQVFAIDRWGDAVTAFEFTPRKHTWVYRGQVIPVDKEVTVQAIITGIDDETRTVNARGYLSVDGRLIYSMKDFELRGV